MVAGLLYIAGLVTAVATVVLVGLGGPALVEAFTAALETAGLLPALTGAAQSLSWAVMPLIGGLVLMGLGRLLMLLRSIDRSLRGNP